MCVSSEKSSCNSGWSQKSFSFRKYRNRDQISSDELNGMPYLAMNIFRANSKFPRQKFDKKVANTRNPFDRLHAAWTDKFRWNSSFQEQIFTIWL